MNVEQASSILHLRSGERVEDCMPALQKVRVCIIGLIENAASPESSARFKHSLQKFDQALKFLIEAKVEKRETLVSEKSENILTEKPKKSHALFYLFLIFALACVGVATWYHWQQRVFIEKSMEYAQLERQAAVFLKQGNTQEAEEVFRKLKSINPTAAAKSRVSLKIDNFK